MLAWILEPRGESPFPLIHMLAMVAAVAWAARVRADRPPSQGAWRLAMVSALLSVIGDGLLLTSAWSAALAAVAFTLGVIAGLALQVVSLLQGWPSRPLVVIGLLAVVTPFLVF